MDAAPPLRRMFGTVSRGPAILAAKRQALQKTAGDERHRRQIPDRLIAGQKTDDEGGKTHDRHGHEKGIFAPDETAEAAEEQRPAGTHREPRGTPAQYEDEFRRLVRSR